MAPNPLDTICSRAWTDLNLDFHLDNWRYCCKSVCSPLPKTFDVDYLTNNPIINKQRNELQNGVKTKLCAKCWEDYKDTGSAWRDIGNRWSGNNPNFKSKPLKEWIRVSSIPAQLVLTFDNICDQSCLYCGPNNSTKWEKELNEYNGTDTNTKNQIDILVDWIVKTYTHDSVAKSVVFQILGGEPTYSYNFYYFLSRLKEKGYGTKKGNIHTIISITSNGNTTEKKMANLLELINDLSFEWHIGLSMEAFGNVGENIRYGLNVKNFERNLKSYLKEDKVSRIVFSPAMNVFNIKTFHLYIEWVHSIIKITNKEKKFTWVGNWVTDSPDQMDCKHLPKSFVKYINMAETVMKETSKDLNIDEYHNITTFFNDMKKRIQNYTENTNIIENYLDHLATIKKNLNKQSLLEQIRE